MRHCYEEPTEIDFHLFCEYWTTNIVCKTTKDCSCYAHKTYTLNVLWLSTRCILHLHVHVNCCYNTVTIGIHIECFKDHSNRRFKFIHSDNIRVHIWNINKTMPLLKNIYVNIYNQIDIYCICTILTRRERMHEGGISLSFKARNINDQFFWTLRNKKSLVRFLKFATTTIGNDRVHINMFLSPGRS